MNSIKVSFLIILISLITTSCKQEVKNNITKKEKKEVIAVYKKSEFHIKGMTCEIGCARLIQSKLSKVDGVKFVKVSFKDSLGMIEFDTNKLNKEKIYTIVNKIAGGDLYKVTDYKDVNNFSLKK